MTDFLANTLTLSQYEIIDRRTGGYSFGKAAWQQVNRSANDPRTLPPDEQLSELIVQYKTIGAEQRSALRKKCLVLASLLHFAHRAAVRAVRQRDEHEIDSGLIALSIEDLRFDFRDTLSLLAMLRYATLQIDGNWEERLRVVRELASEAFDKLLDDFSSRQDQLMKEMQEIAFKTGQSTDGPTIEWRI